LTVEEVKRGAPPIIPLIVLAAILSYFGVMWQLLITSNPPWIVNSLGVSVCNVGLTTAPFLIFLLAVPLSRISILKDKITTTNMAYAYMAAFTVSYYMNYPWANNVRYLWASRYMEQNLADIIVPWFMSPSASVCRAMAYGTMDWGPWIVPLLWWWTVNIGQGISFLAIGTILRRQWIDVEQVPFPQVIVAKELMNNVTPNVERTGSKKRWFLVGILLGLAFQLPTTLTGIFPWFPDIYGVRVNTCAHLTRFFTASDVLGTIPGMMSINYNPIVVAIAYQAPMAVLFSTWFFALVRLILTQIAYVMGSYTGIEGVGTCGRDWCHPSPDTDMPLEFAAIGSGGLIALGLMHLVLNRKYIGETFRAAMGSGNLKGQEKDEAMSYRNAYILLFGSFIFMFIFWMASGLSFLDALALFGGGTIVNFSLVRVWGLSGAEWPSSAGTVFPRLVYSTVQSPPTTQQYIVYKWAWQAAGGGSVCSWGGMGYASFAGYNMGKSTNIHPKNTFKVVLIAMIIGPIFSLLSLITVVHGFGGAKIAIWKNWFEGIGERWALIPGWWTASPAAEPWLPYVIAGAAWIAVLSFLHARFVWFPLEPIGWILGTTSASSLFGLWIPFLAAWILKTITFRIGGAKLLENMGLPISSGAVAGCMIGILLGGAMFIIRFFVPF